MPGQYDLVLYRGDYRSIPMQFRQPVSGGGDGTEPVDITGLDWAAQIRETYDAEQVVATFTINVVNAQDGLIDVTLPTVEAKKFQSLKSAVWDLESTDAQGRKQTWVYGSVTIDPDVTRSAE